MNKVNKEKEYSSLRCAKSIADVFYRKSGCVQDPKNPLHITCSATVTIENLAACREYNKSNDVSAFPLQSHVISETEKKFPSGLVRASCGRNGEIHKNYPYLKISVETYTNKK